MSQHGCPERLSNRTKGFQEEGGSEPTMEVLVETLTGTAFEMTVSPSDTIFAIKSKIFRVEGIPIGQQHLLYNLKELDDGSSLSELAIGDGARLRLVLGMRGGPISTRRLPQPAPAHQDFWPARIERLLDSNRDEGEWSGAGGGAGAGCKVTVLVFRDGERVNMLRVKENTDGTYSPIEHAKYSSTTSGTNATGGGGAGTGGGAGVAEAETRGALPAPPIGADNVVTHAKMADLRRRMDTLSLLKHNRKHTSTSSSMQKTRSEETLYGGGRGAGAGGGTWRRYGEDGAVTPVPDGNFTRYEYDCSFADRYTLLPPIGPRASPTAPATSACGAHSTRSVSSLRLCAVDAPPAPPAADRPPYAALSSSTSDLHSTHRVLPALSRHRHRSQLHLPDEAMEAGVAAAAAAAGAGGGARRERCCRCRKRLGAATLLRCRCGAACCAEHRYPDTHHCTLLHTPHPAPPTDRL